MLEILKSIVAEGGMPNFVEKLTSLDQAITAGTFIVEYQEGALSIALRKGHWVLLDEANLAS